MTLLTLLIALLLLLLNAFFVLAEFAAVKMRPTRTEELARSGGAPARMLKHVQEHMDEYLSVCQVGITLASIGLGFVGEPAAARLIEPAVAWLGSAGQTVAHSISITVAYLLISFLHIVLGELVPKSVAIRRVERSALLTARPLRVFHALFFVPLWILNRSANLVLQLVRIPAHLEDERHSRQELGIILARSQERGLLSLRRLLFVENIFDLEGVRVRDVMRPRAKVEVLRTRADWEENFRTIRQTRFSRYPLLETDAAPPVGIVHVKDLLYGMPEVTDLRRIARPYVKTTPDATLEDLLAELQRNRVHVALALGSGSTWVGMITMEDIIEEIIGTVEDEFEDEPLWSLADALTADRIVLDIEASSLEEAIRTLVTRAPESALPAPRQRLLLLFLERERVMSTYLGGGVALPHARLEDLRGPQILLGLSRHGIPIRDGRERAFMIFALLTPAASPHSHVRLLKRIAGMIESEFILRKLAQAHTPEEILEIIQQAEIATMGAPR
ncbi:MAG: DUF21 domain-containing protein [Planctomycetes bacterium]|nr:DUF21 domain-containing protein [Planctomycetota bacterium]